MSKSVENQRNRKGAGSIIKLPNGKFRAELKYTNTCGVKKRVSKTVNSQTAADKALIEMRKLAKEDNQVISDQSKFSVENYINNIFLPYKKHQLKADSSYKRLASTINTHIIPLHGYKQLAQVSTADIVELLEHKKNIEGLSYSSVKKIHDAYTNLFNYATRRHDIDARDNPMLLVEMMPETSFETQKPIRWFTHDEAQRFSAAAMAAYSTGRPVYRYGVVLLFLLNTGLRAGEVCALNRRTEVDLKKKIIYINHSVSDQEDGQTKNGTIRYTKQIGTTKRPSSIRAVPLNDVALQCAEQILATFHHDEYFICTEQGDIVPPGTLNKQMNSILKRAGIEQCGPHTLRHTFVSILFDKEVDEHTIAALIGDSVSTLRKTYLHLFNERKARAIDMINITNFDIAPMPSMMIK